MNATTLNFTAECMDCGRAVKTVDGRERWHFCPVLPWLRGRVSDAYWQGYRFGEVARREDAR